MNVPITREELKSHKGTGTIITGKHPNRATRRINAQNKVKECNNRSPKTKDGRFKSIVVGFLRSVQFIGRKRIIHYTKILKD